MMPAITRDERTGRERCVVVRCGNALYERFVPAQLKRRVLDMLVRGQPDYVLHSGGGGNVAKKLSGCIFVPIFGA